VPPDAPPAPTPTRLRLVAGNITSGNGQAYEPPGIRIFRGIAPDIAMIQEFNFAGGTPTDLRSFVDQAFGPEFNFTRGASVQQIPNGVVTRYPILDSGEWVDPEVSNRAFTWARLDIPGPIDLVAISVHLLTANASTRNAEAIELVRNMQTLSGNPYIVLGGDFNTDTRTEPALSTLSSVVVTAGPHPADQAGNGDTNASRAKPYDWVLANPALDALEIPATIGANQFANGLVVDTRVYQPIANLAPAVASDSAANMMQHMAVVRDFLIPGGAPPVASLHVTSPNGGEVWQVGTNRTITWESSGVANVRVELITGSIVWTVATSIPAVNGEISLTVPPAVTTEAFARITEVGGPLTDSSDAPFSITMTPPPTGRAFINEVLANEPGTDVAGEFIELVNSGANDVDLAGWTLADSAQVRHTFAAGTLLRVGRALVVFGGAASIPAGLTNAVVASTNALGLSNGGDTVTLASPAGTVDSVTFNAAQALDGVSINRSPDGSDTGTFVLHTTLSTTATISPGLRTTGAAF
ncbi:MAG: lamin tail domain-containing protein, partial [Myxococcales bacterium]|nr:lamin tail domain-containing protein [Myxococcales bacterium]